jgi:hypothetical protein
MEIFWEQRLATTSTVVVGALRRRDDPDKETP